jgi:hypothetical protein
VEVEVWPASAEALFADEGYADPLNTQIRFQAAVYNGASGVKWSVYSVTGGPGAGTIDSTGLYLAPVKGMLSSGHTEIVQARSEDDPLRAAYAWVTLTGRGPVAQPDPRIQIFPRHVNLYYDSGHDNSYMDPSNKRQIFRALVYNAGADETRWKVKGSITAGPTLEYVASSYGGTDKIEILAYLNGREDVNDMAYVHVLNYDWPGLP